MIKYDTAMKFLLIPCLILSLAGCNPPWLKPDSGADTRPSSAPGPGHDLPALAKRAEAAYLADDLKGSEKDYKMLIKSRSGEALYHYRLANIYARTQRPEQAIVLYRQALGKDPAFPAAWYNLSIVQLKQAAYSLSEMLDNTGESDPLHKKVKAMLRGIEALINTD